MQCKNCGSHYRMRELACPYCGTENALGRVWMKQRTDAEIAYERERVAAGKRWSPFIYNRAVSRVIVVEIVLTVLLFLFLAGFYGGREVIYSIVSKEKNDDRVEKMNTLLESGKLEELQYNWNEYSDQFDDADSDPRFRKIRQISNLVHAHNEYLNSKFDFLDLDEEKKKEDDFRLSYVIRVAYRVYTFEPYYGEEFEPETEALLSKYKDEVHAFMVGMLKLSEEEFDEMMAMDYFYFDDDTWEKIVRDRNGW
ncbi:MAG: hypothetical protein IKG47_09560 [Oscillospiraceae bacterium]|nr:hypothetical protein [Oscillospiraceae bacterium]